MKSIFYILTIAIVFVGNVVAQTKQISNTVGNSSLLNQSGAIIPWTDPSEGAKIAQHRSKNSPAITGSFTDSQGRTLMYRFSIPEGINSASQNAVFLSFHGNNTGSQADMLNMFFSGIEYEASGRNMIPVVLASPEAHANGVRFWNLEKDQRTIDEFIKNKLPTHFGVNTEQIYFAGGSQGTCFLNNFLQRYGENYKGGFYGGCGCYPALDASWSPTNSFKDNFKVFVGSTQGDFLIGSSQGGYGYYKYTIGLNTRGDFESQGGHCELYWSQQTKALDWFTGVVNIPEPPFEPHWKRVSPIDNLKGIAVDDSDKIWAIQQFSSSQFRLLKSIDGGKSFISTGSTVNGIARDFVFSKGKMIVTGDNGVTWRSDNYGQSFNLLPNDPTFEGGRLITNSNLIENGKGSIFRSGYPNNQKSNDYGSSWSNVTPAPQSLNDVGIVNLDPSYYGQNPFLIISDKPTNPVDVFTGTGSKYLGMANSNIWQPINDTPLGDVAHAAWDGSYLWSISSLVWDANYYGYARIFKSSNLSSTWQSISTPFENHSVYGARLTALGEDRVLLHGGLGEDINDDPSSWLTVDGGDSWSLIHGLAHVTRGDKPYGEPAFNKSLKDIYYSDGAGVFKLKLATSLEIERPPVIIAPIISLLFDEDKDPDLSHLETHLIDLKFTQYHEGGGLAPLISEIRLYDDQGRRLNIISAFASSGNSREANILQPSGEWHPDYLPNNTHWIRVYLAATSVVKEIEYVQNLNAFCLIDCSPEPNPNSLLRGTPSQIEVYNFNSVKTYSVPQIGTVKIILN